MRFPRHSWLVALAAGAAVGCQEGPHDTGSRSVDEPETLSFSLLCEGTSYTGQYLAEFAATYRAFYESHTVAICKPVETAIAMPAPPSVEPSRDPLRGPRGPLHFSPPTSPLPAP